MFLDCVYQLLKQQPRAFEFDESLLLSMMDAAISGRFGTFMFVFIFFFLLLDVLLSRFDCERERAVHDVFTKTPCFLNWVLQHKQCFANRSYFPVSGIIQVSSSMKRLTVWKEWFLRYAN